MMAEIKVYDLNLSIVAQTLANQLGGSYGEAAVTVGEVDGVVFRLVALNGMYAEDHDCAEGPAWAKCITKGG